MKTWTDLWSLVLSWLVPMVLPCPKLMLALLELSVMPMLVLLLVHQLLMLQLLLDKLITLMLLDLQ